MKCISIGIKTMKEVTFIFSIDREKRSFYNFIATVSDEDGLFSSANINLRILDVNDNPPKFSRSGNFLKNFNHMTHLILNLF